MLRSILGILAGVSLTCGCLLGLLLVLPGVAPAEIPSCTTGQGATTCFGSENPTYSMVFLGFLAGIVLTFLALFGRRFVLNSYVPAGMTLLAVGSYSLIFAYLNRHSGCGFARVPSSCLAYHPEFPALVVAGGLLLIAFSVFRQIRSLHQKSQTKQIERRLVEK